MHASSRGSADSLDVQEVAVVSTSPVVKPMAPKVLKVITAGDSSGPGSDSDEEPHERLDARKAVPAALVAPSSSKVRKNLPVTLHVLCGRVVRGCRSAGARVVRVDRPGVA